MTSAATPRHPAITPRLAQRRAADPRASAWVSANAGAGKTKVLTDRVRAAAARPARRPDGSSASPSPRRRPPTWRSASSSGWRSWVTLDEDSRSATSSPELEGSRPTPDQLRQARRLFARAVETPGGLKIDTIHAFCERLLHLVPFEANVPARFAVLDESQIGEHARAGDERRCWRMPRRAAIARSSPTRSTGSASMLPASG